ASGPPAVGWAEVEPAASAERGGLQRIDDEIGQLPAPREAVAFGPRPRGLRVVGAETGTHPSTLPAHFPALSPLTKRGAIEHLHLESLRRRPLTTKVLGDCGPAAVHRPTEWRAAINRVLDVQAGASFDEQAHHVRVVRPHRLMQRRGMGMVAIGVVAARIL